MSMIIHTTCDAINSATLYSSRYNRDYFHLEGIGHAMKAIQELGSAPIYDSYNSTYNPSHGPRKGERDAPRTLVTLHLPTPSWVARGNLTLDLKRTDETPGQVR